MKPKNIPVPEVVQEDAFPDKISLEEMRTFWNNEQYTYTDDELIRIREWFYGVAAIINKVCAKKMKQQAPVISLQSENDEKKQSGIVYPGIYRRAG